MAAEIKPSGGRRWHAGKARPPHPTRLGLLRTCAALLLLLLGSAPLLASAQDGPLTLSGTALVVSVTHRDGTSQRILGVRTDDGRRIQVQAPGPAAAQAASLVTGRRIRVAGLWMHPEAAPGLPKPSPHFLAASIQAIDGQLGVRAKPAAAAASGVAAAAAVPVPSPPPPVSKQARMSKNELISDDVSVMFIPIAAVTGSGASCPLTAAPMYTVAAVKKAAFEELNPGGVTIGSTFNRCSYNTSRLTMANSVVTPVVQLPCSGTTLGTAWTFSKCDFADFNGYADAAEEALRKKGYKPENYKHKVYLLPPNSCSFVGLGYVGCNGPDDCRVWITADFWTSVNAIAHELGHNLFLAHAGAMTNSGQYDEYADLTGMMGYCCSDRCPNTAHAWQLGWITAQELSWSSMSPGQTQTFTVNSQSLSRLTGVRLTNLPINDPLFVGYRTRAGGDATATSDIAGDVGGPGRLHIYTAPIANTWDAKMTTKQATLNAAGQSWALPGTRLVVRLVRATNSAAVVTLCRKAGPETAASCQAGLDNDCNGKVGAADAACAPLLRREARAAPLKRARLAQ